MIGIGGSTAAEELAKIQPRINQVKPIQKEEFQERIQRAAKLMNDENIVSTYVHSGTNLFYFTGMRWNASERMVGALILPNGTIHYIAPQFEKGTIFDFMLLNGEVHCWEEHESPFELLLAILKQNGIESGQLAMDEMTPFFMTNSLSKVNTSFSIIDATPVTAGCRMQKSKNEIAIMQAAMDITLEVQKAAARILYVGISAKEVVDFINEAHIRYGIPSGSYFCIVLFGVDSAFPHGVKSPKNLEANEMVLIDTGCVLHDYISDITRTYVFGTPTDEQKRIWNVEKATQLAAFDKAKLGTTCGAIDDASRVELSKNGLSKDYDLPGLPHRTGHGIGLNIHEHPYIVRNNAVTLKEGMTFSNEPMIVIPDAFGIRLEDHVYMTTEGSKWFTEPAHSIENPFGY
ncbi:M24 family metallopeptidase [Urechidicola vernalis]|uniref:Xaa-Pro peptidase family protein n=1 Tax=Urechidicola vernalis TaxID=3075600 RepID=A0ABU2Y5R8_9FLAO|nr:Xaa-Pro peptidase family protein [Urechidicola sp. P050]MDT0553551.1 Xaa-Pro peptidase family protein [Urechidicola sp. P050]